jgi:hypothetical protein
MHRSLLLLVLVACSSTSTVAPETEGPLAAGALGRQAFRGPHGPLLARNADDAADVAALMAEAAGDFRARTGREPSARLLVLAGAGGWGSSDEERFIVGQRAQTALDGEPPLSPAEEVSQTGNFLEESEESHVPPAVMLTMRPTPLLPSQLIDLGLPPELTGPVDWGLVLPTPDELDEAVELAIDLALENEDIGFGQRMLIVPFLPFARGAMADAMRAAAKGTVFAMHAAAQPDWDVAHRKEEVQAYLLALEGEIVDDMESAERGNPAIVDP